MGASRILAMMAVVSLLVSVACGPSASTVKVTKELNESTARELIKDRLSKEPSRIPVDSVSRLFGRTLTDYRRSNTQYEPGATLKRLLDKGFVQVAVDTTSHPVISGTFVAQNFLFWTTYDGQSAHYRLEMLPDSNILSGEFRIRTVDNREVPHTSEMGVRGSVEPDGRIEQLATTDSSRCDHGRYVEQGAAAYLYLVRCGYQALDGVGIKWEGRATGKRTDVKWYTYSWSPEFEKKLVRVQSMTYVIGGSYEVGDVSGLRLVTDTEATAKFGWKAPLNDLGKLFFPIGTPSGASQATFGKKPDGTWFVDHLGIND